MGGALSLDTIISALTWAVPKWTPTLKRNASRDVLRLLVCKLHGQSHGNLFAARVMASQDAVAAHLGVSREWVCKLLARLKAQGWIEYQAVRLPDGRFLPAVFRAGPQLKRLVCVLVRYRRPRSNRVNIASQSLPKKEIERNLSFLRELREQLSKRLKFPHSAKAAG